MIIVWVVVFDKFDFRTNKDIAESFYYSSSDYIYTGSDGDFYSKYFQIDCDTNIKYDTECRYSFSIDYG